jgi:hypothetical protein
MADSVEKAIRDRWASSADLSALMSVDSLTTGWSHEEKATDEQLPAGMLNVQSTRGNYTSDGRSDEVGVRLQIWSREHAEGKAIRDQICGYRGEASWVTGVFDNVSWQADGTNVSLCRVDNDFAFQEEDGVWQFVFDLTVIYDGR